MATITPIHNHLHHAPTTAAAKPAGTGHGGEDAFRRHAVAVYMGYMAVTILISALYMIPVVLYAYFN